jgi:FkbM family methyltransferase
VSNPSISVVVLPFTGRDPLVVCLDALSAQGAAVNAEIIVPLPDSIAGAASLRMRYPHAVFLAAPGRTTPAGLRALGVSAARAEVVALLEDHCVPDCDWCERILEWHRGPYAAVGGAMEKGFAPGRTGDSALNWAVYMTDYSRYMNPLPAGPAVSVTDSNSSYKKNGLDHIRMVWRDEFHENVVNQHLRERGGTLWFAPDVIVREWRNLTLGAAIRDRYAFGRLFASTRVSDASTARRIIMSVASVAMPPVLVFRVARTVFGRGRHRLQFLRSLPQLALVTSAWMGGEMVGYLTARPEATLSATTPREPGGRSGPHALSARGRIADFVGCARALGPDARARAAILWRLTRNLRVRLGLGRHRPETAFALRTTFGTLHFRDNFGDVTNLTKLLFKEEYKLPRLPGDGVIMDVGANIGMAAVWFDARYPGRPIHCFEPLAENARLIALNAPAARVNAVAAGAKDGITTLSVDSDAVMASRIPYARAAGDRQVRVVALDDYVREEGVDRIAILKIDAEGMELDVLEGARESLDRTDTIAMETHGRVRHAEAITRLSAAGFVVQREEFGESTGLVFAARPLATESPRPD